MGKNLKNKLVSVTLFPKNFIFNSSTIPFFKMEQDTDLAYSYRDRGVIFQGLIVSKGANVQLFKIDQAHVSAPQKKYGQANIRDRE